MPRKRVEERANHERWLVSYADFITLLFAFFVVMFATSHVDKKKVQQVSDSVQQAINKGAQVSHATKDPNSTATGNPDVPEIEAQLKMALSEEITAGKVSIHMEPRGLVISLRQGAFFPSGGDTIAPDSYPSVAKIAAVMKKMPGGIQLEGHTDSVPIHNEHFRSNWELSTARSIAMMDLLCTRYEISNKRFGVAGYADTQPVASNEEEQGREHNRRVDVVLLNQPRESAGLSGGKTSEEKNE